ncbi:MAG: flotillin-like FloA family protein [Puniceicoccales bacterium]|jgi:uncharacterized protein YqfA (UPF0365 family)|nr:flotillin-like FloA family protein [Puniceicoccales bacterium]
MLSTTPADALALAALSVSDKQTLVIVIVAIIALFLLGCLLWLLGPWVRALFAGTHIGLWRLFSMSVRRIPVDALVTARITAAKASLPVGLDELESHHLAGGNIVHTVKACIAAEHASLPFTWEKAAAVDLATRGTGTTVLDAVHAALNPKVVEFPDAISGVSKDGIEVRAKVRATLRANLSRFIRGAGEATVIARVGEAVVAAIGNAETYREILEKPSEITKTILDKGLDSGAAYDLISLDIVAIEVQGNTGARLREEQADSEKNIAQAQAEVRRVTALAAEQEMRAKTQRMRSLLIESETQVPLALAEALRAGRLGVVDFHRLQNLKADTQMRLKLGLPDEEWERGNK